MENTAKTLQINNIIFESGDSDVLIKGTVSSGHMTYSTDALISMSMLNHLISQLQRENDSLEFNDLLVSEKMEDGALLYSASVSHLAYRMIDLNTLSPQDSVRQIRA